MTSLDVEIFVWAINVGGLTPALRRVSLFEETNPIRRQPLAGKGVDDVRKPICTQAVPERR